LAFPKTLRPRLAYRRRQAPAGGAAMSAEIASRQSMQAREN
jgi:hypothetical protein